MPSASGVDVSQRCNIPSPRGGREGVKYPIIQKQQLICVTSRGEEHARDILSLVIILHAKQLACPEEVVFLRKVFTATEHQMVTLGGRPLQHQQSQFIALTHHQLGDTRHLLRKPSLLLFS